MPRYRLPGGDDGQGQRRAVGRPVQQGQPEHRHVAAGRQPDAGDPVQESLQPGREVVQPGPGRLPPRQPVHAMRGAEQQAAEGRPDSLVADGQQHRGPGHQVHRRPREADGRADSAAAGDGPGRQEQGKRGRGEDAGDRERPAGGGRINAVPAELPVGVDGRQPGPGERQRHRHRAGRVADPDHRATAGRPAAGLQQAPAAERERQDRGRLGREGQHEPGPPQLVQHAEGPEQVTVVDDHDRGDDRDHRQPRGNAPARRAPSAAPGVLCGLGLRDLGPRTAAHHPLCGTSRLAPCRESPRARRSSL